MFVVVVTVEEEESHVSMTSQLQVLELSAFEELALYVEDWHYVDLEL